MIHLSATEILKKLKSGEVTAEAVFQAHLGQVERLNPELKALVYLDRAGGLAWARHADETLAQGKLLGPLHGLPMSVKDTWDVEGMPTTNGLPWLKNNRPERDAACVERLRAAGANLWAKSNLPFASYDWQCINPLFGRCANPWDRDHTPGGSSGGSAAAVAAGLSPLELGSDVAGSIRFPAHCCGVYGLRTTEGSLPDSGHAHVPGGVHGVRNLVSMGPLARTLPDLELLLEVLSGGSGKPVDAAQLRVAWHPGHGGWPLCQGTRHALEQTVSALTNRVARVEKIHPPWDPEEAVGVWGAIQGFEFGVSYPRRLQNRFCRWVHSLTLPFLYGRSCWTRALAKGLNGSRADYFDALHRRDQMIGQMDEFLQDWDLWVTPTALRPAFSHRRPGRSVEIDGVKVPYSMVAGLNNPATAVTAHPILVVPVTVHEGLPIGLQLHARRGCDHWLVQAALSLEELWCSQTLVENYWTPPA